MNMDQGSDTPTWTIIGISDTTEFDPATGVEGAKRVAFRTAAGVESAITVRDRDFNPQTVQNAVHDMAMKMLQVHGMTGPTFSQMGMPPQTEY